MNQHLLHDLTTKGLWNPDLKNELVAANGSVQVGGGEGRPGCGEIGFRKHGKPST